MTLKQEISELITKIKENQILIEELQAKVNQAFEYGEAEPSDKFIRLHDKYLKVIAEKDKEIEQLKNKIKV